MLKPKKFRWLMILAIPVMILINVFAAPEADPMIKNRVQTQRLEKKIYKDNTTTYAAKDGQHTIYWQQGITPPKMSSDPTLLGTDGYFSYEEIGGFGTYEAEYQPGHGYYDYNKNFAERPDESVLCYLGAAGNLIKWWLDQNKVYVDEYISRLRDTDIYDQIPGLKDVSTFDQTLWDKILEEPVVGNQSFDGQSYKSQELGLSLFITDILKPYYYKKADGFFPDFVFDFFFNGYDAIPSLNDFTPNSEDKFIKDPRGGFFHPIFGKERITQRLSGGEYNTLDYYEKNMPRFFREGKGVATGLAVSGGTNAHAITIWGAEYDASGNLIRLFITDTDDNQSVDKDDEYFRGLNSFNTVADKNGKLILNNNLNSENITSTNYVLDTILLDLAQDTWVEKLADKSGPKEAVINSAPKDRVIALGANIDLFIDVTLLDSGYLNYQWYSSKKREDKGTPIKGANKPTLNITADSLGNTYYYCVVQNIKNGKIISVESEHFEISVQDIALKNAQVPNVTFNTAGIELNRYTKSKSLYVNASVSDKGHLTYQWYASTVMANNIEEGKWKKLEGETSPTFYPSTANADVNFYFCVVTNTNYDESITGNNVSTRRTQFSKRVKVNDAEYQNVAEPVIIEESKTYHEVKQNQPVELSVRAKTVDGGSLSYQWVKVNQDYSEEVLDGETKPTLKVNTKVPGVRDYKCIVKSSNSKALTNKEANIESNKFTVSVQGDYIPSSKNKLTSLVVNNATLTPTFNPNTYEYQINVDSNVEKLDIVATAEEKAEVKIDNPILVPGLNTITIKVTAENGAIQNYVIKVTKEIKHNFGEVQYEWLDNNTKLKATRKCLDCDLIETEVVDVTYKVVLDPTCTVSGIGRFTSNGFNNEAFSVQTKDIEIAAKGHNFGEWEIIKEPTLTETGLKQRVCECGEVETEVIPKLEAPVDPGDQEVNPDPNPETPEIPEEKPEVTPEEKPEEKPEEVNPEVNHKDDVKIKIAIAIGVIIPVFVLGALIYLLLINKKK